MIGKCTCHTDATTFHCGGCGLNYHVSLMQQALRAVAEKAYDLGKMTREEAINTALHAGYAVEKRGEHWTKYEPRVERSICDIVERAFTGEQEDAQP